MLRRAWHAAGSNAGFHNRGKQMKTASYVLALLLITAVAFYVGTAGWMNADLDLALKENAACVASNPVELDGVQFASVSALKRYQTARQVKQWFPWIVELPGPLALVLTAV